MELLKGFEVLWLNEFEYMECMNTGLCWDADRSFLSEETLEG